MTLTKFFVNVADPSDSESAMINNLGQVAGYIVQSNLYDVAIYNTASGTVSNLGSPPGSNHACGRAVNIQGHVIANEINLEPMAYFYNGTSWTNIVQPGYAYLNLTALNDSDEVIGMGWTNGNWYGFSWTPSAGISFLNPVGDSLYPLAINNKGTIVGEEATLGFPFANYCGTNLDVDTIVLGPVTKRPPSWTELTTIDNAFGINDSGNIVGTGPIYGDGGHEYLGIRGFVLPRVGQSQYLPYLPGCSFCSTNGWLCFLIDIGSVVGLGWIDPAIASGFHYEMQSDALFTEIANFPVGFTNTYTVSVKGTVLGQFVQGQSVVFSNYVAQLGSSRINSSGVQQFDVTGIAPLVAPQNPQAFPLQIGFNQTNGTISMFMAAISTTPPQLSIVATRTNAIVSWPASVAGWTLQTNNNPATGTWVNYAGPVINNIVTIGLATGNVFFRLMLP